MGWRAEYMQEPIERFGLLLPLDELQFTDVVPKYVFFLCYVRPHQTEEDDFSVPLRLLLVLIGKCE